MTKTFNLAAGDRVFMCGVATAGCKVKVTTDPTRIAQFTEEEWFRHRLDLMTLKEVTQMWRKAAGANDQTH